MNLKQILSLHCSLVATLMLCALVTTSCATGTVRPPTPIPGELLALLQPQPSPDAFLLSPCPVPPPAVDDAVSNLLRNQQFSAKLANQCRSKHQGLIDAEAERKKFEAERIERAAQALQKR